MYRYLFSILISDCSKNYEKWLRLLAPHSVAPFIITLFYKKLTYLTKNHGAMYRKIMQFIYYTMQKTSQLLACEEYTNLSHLH